jgi:hypothetical protein
MTEAEWLDCADPGAMLEFLRDGCGTDKLRLFACACCRRAWYDLRNPFSRGAVEVAERYALGGAASAAAQVAGYLGRYQEMLTEVGARLLEWDFTWADADAVAGWCARAAHRLGAEGDGPTQERAIQAGILRDLLGPLPFRPAPFEPRWRTHEVLTIARATRRHHAFADLPLLADGLEEAGCAGEELLAHLRGGGLHYLGCWALDLVLGKG